MGRPSDSRTNGIRVELADDLRPLIEYAAADAGVTPERYILEALARVEADRRTGHSTHTRSLGHAGAEPKVAYIGRIWEAFSVGGLDELADLVAPDVRWRPLQGGGRVLHGLDELREFWAARPVALPVPRMFHVYGDDVLVESELVRPDGGVTTLWSLYRFAGARLAEAASFESRAEALAYAA